MDIRVNKSHLQTVLKVAHRVTVGGRPGSDLKVLKCALITLEDTELVIEATNVDVSIRAVIDGVKGTPGAAAVPVKELVEFCRHVDGDEIRIKSDGPDWVRVNQSKQTFRIRCVDVDDVPKIPTVDVGWTPLAEDFLDHVERVSFSISKDEVEKPGLCSAQVLPHGVVSSDGHRLSISAGDTGIDDEVLIRGRLLSAVSELDGALQFGKDDEHIAVRSVYSAPITITLIGQPPITKFPGYQPLIPDRDLLAELPTDTLRLALQMARHFCHENELNIEPDKFFVMVSATRGDRGSFRQLIPAKWVNRRRAPCEGHAKTPITLNIKYITQVLQHIESEHVMLSLGTSKAPVVVRPGDNDVDHQWIIMPIGKEEEDEDANTEEAA